MSAAPTPEEILEALGRTGFLFEQEVAMRLQDIGLHVNTGVAYEDPDEGKSREIDVVATRLAHLDNENMVGVQYDIICECKNTQWPFVLLGPARGGEDFLRAPVGYTFPISHFAEPLKQGTSKAQGYMLVPAFTQLKLAGQHYSSDSPRAIQVVRISRKGNKWQADNEGMFDSIIYPVAKALLARTTEYGIDQPPEPGQLALIYLCFPTVVTSGKLYFLDTTEESPTPREASHVTLLRELRTKNTYGYFMIDFVTKEGLSSFVRDKVDSFVQAVVQRVISAPSHYFHSQRQSPEFESHPSESD